MAAAEDSGNNGTLVYALIGKRTDVLAEYMEPNTDIQVSTVTRVLLQRISDEDQRKTYAYDEKYLFHCIVEVCRGHHSHDHGPCIRSISKPLVWWWLGGARWTRYVVSLTLDCSISFLHHP